jgi:hypothetical protein
MNPSQPWYKYNIQIIPEPPTPPVTDTTIYLSSSGTSFAPRLHLFDGYDAEVTWTFSDGSTSSSLTPTVSFGSSAVREHTLQVSPPSAIHALNFGYNGADGGEIYSSLAEYQHTTTNINTISNIVNGAPNLERFFANNTPITSVDFTGCDNLQIADLYSSDAATVNFSGCTALLRACLEETNISVFDLSDAEFIEDVRGRYRELNVILGNVSNMWHLCVGNGTITGINSILNGTIEMPVLRELFLWNGYITSAFTPRCTATNIDAAVNNFTSFSSENITWIGNGRLNLSSCQSIASVNLTGSANALEYVNFYNCLFSQTLVDYILGVFAGGTRSDGTLIINNNSIPSATGLDYVTTLRARGWTVTVDT